MRDRETKHSQVTCWKKPVRQTKLKAFNLAFQVLVGLSTTGMTSQKALEKKCQKRSGSRNTC